MTLHSDASTADHNFKLRHSAAALFGVSEFESPPHARSSSPPLQSSFLPVRLPRSSHPHSTSSQPPCPSLRTTTCAQDRAPRCHQEKNDNAPSAQLQTPAFSADTLVFDEPAEGRTYVVSPSTPPALPSAPSWCRRYCNTARTLSPRGRVPLGRPSRLCALPIGTLARVPHTHTAHSALLLASVAMLPGLTCCPNLLRRMDGPDTLQRVRRHRHSACALHWLGARQRPGTLRILIDLSEERQKRQDPDYVDPETEEAEQDAVAEFYQPVQLPTEQEEAEALCAKFGWQTKQFLLGESNDFDVAQAIGLTHDGQHLVTCPNASDIPKPLPNTRVVRMRRDGRFGPDDPMYRPVSIANHTLILSAETAPDIGFLSLEYEQRFEPLRFEVHLYAHKLAKDLEIVNRQTEDKDVYLFLGLEQHIHHEHCRAKSAPSSWSDLRFLIVTLQRHIIEAFALKMYITTVRPRLAPTTVLKGRLPEPEDVLGAFVRPKQDLLARRLAYAGVPVFQLHDFAEIRWILSNTARWGVPKAAKFVLLRDRLEHVTREDDMVDMEVDGIRKPWPVHPVIYKGPQDHELMLQRMHDYKQTFFRTTDVWDAPTTQPWPTHFSMPLGNTSDSSKREAYRTGLPSHRRGAKDKAPKARYAEPPIPSFGDDAPFAPSFWRDSVEKYKSTRGFNGKAVYPSPPPRLLLASGTSDKRAKVFQFWALSQPYLLALLVQSMSAPRLHVLMNQEWRVVLQLPFKRLPTTSSMSSSSSSSPATFAEAEIENVLNIFGDLATVQRLISRLGGPYEYDSDKIVGIPSAETARKMLWFAHEVLFRAEFVNLNREMHARTRGDNLFQMDVVDEERVLSRCFALETRDDGCFIIPRFPKTGDVGLVAHDWTHRHPFMTALACAMEGWTVPAAVPEVIHARREEIGMWKEREYLQWEKDLVEHYVACFVEVFTYLPEVPRRLF
ncbi:hypothetical protein GGG16DRAFT_116632 [Schizophyllum commune]